LITPINAEKKTKEVFFYGMLIASIAIILSLWVFSEQASMVMVFLTVLTSMPLVYSMTKYEESKDLRIEKERTLIKEHGKALKSLIALFLGFVIAYALWFILLPAETTSSLFNVQVTTINSINSRISGGVVSSEIFFHILGNNFKVLFFCIIFAFFYGAGALFILTWNASVIAAAIGAFVRNQMTHLAGYFALFPIAIMRYMTHGIFEILAYFIAGLGGGIISVAVINHRMGTKRFLRVLVDSLDLIGLSVLVLIFAGLIEVYVTPLFF
jgi:uncharacterized membrane protein SpoIIM required for sporulation